MDDAHIWYDVYYTHQVAKKHKNWTSGFLKWNPDNSLATLYQEDKKSKFGDGFMPGGPNAGCEFLLAGHLVELNTDATPSAPVASKPIIRSRVVHQPPKAAPSVYRKPEPVTRAVPQPTETDHLNSSKSPSSTPPSATPPNSTIRKRPYTQLPFRAPARTEYVAEPEVQEEPKYDISQTRTTPHSFAAPAPTYEPVQASHPAPAPAPTSYYPMLSWSAFESISEPQFVEEVKFKPSAEMHAGDLFGTDYFPKAEDPRSSAMDIDAKPDIHATSTLKSKDEDAFTIHAQAHEEVSSRVPTFQKQGQSVDLSAVVGKKRAPPPLPPRADGVIVSAAQTDVPKVSAASPFAVSAQSSAPHGPLTTPPKSTHSLPKPASAALSRPSAPGKLSSNASSSSFTKASPPAPSAASNSNFKTPTAFNPHDEILGFGNKTLVFPSRKTIAQLPKFPRRAAAITPSFNSINDYKQQFTEAMIEDINHGLLPVATKFHAAYTRHAQDSRKPTESVKSAIASMFRSVYYDCELIRYNVRSAKKRTRGGDEVAPKVSAVQLPVYLKLPQSQLSRDSGTSFSKDDLWIICTCADFEPQNGSEHLFFARSAAHGKPQGVMEIIPIVEGPFKAMAKTMPKLDGELPVHAIHAMSVSGDMSSLDAIAELSVPAMPLLPYVLNRHPSFAQKPTLRAALPSSFVHTLLQSYLENRKLNEDQYAVFKRAALWFDAKHQKSELTPPFVLVHGVFGSGKSVMLVALIEFMCELAEQIERIMPPTETDTNKRPEKFRILVSAATNTAVDRILVALLEEGFTDFVRVGSLKRINSRILPYSIHREKRGGGSGPNSDDFEESSSHDTCTGARKTSQSDRTALRDLEELLRSKTLTSVERALIEQQRTEIESGSFERKLDLVESASVVGATCIATTFPILKSSKFDIVILDECSQIPEPLSLLPTSRFGSVGYVLVGDPLQLPPTLRTKPKTDNDDAEGLGLTLFSRLAQLGSSVEPILLRTQYRLHPLLSSIPNELFYQKRLINGITPSDRAALHPLLPNIVFIDNVDSSERVAAGGSIENAMEANIVTILLRQLVSTFNIEGDRIGVICPYKAQAAFINRLLESQASAGADFADELASVQVSTVDAFQGAEKDVIILSTCRADKEGSSQYGGLGSFLNSPYRVNVSLTRGRRHLFVIGCAPLMMSSTKWKVVVELAKACGPRSYIAGHSILTGDYFKG